MVASVNADSAAEKAGIEPGDLIVKIDDMRIDSVRGYSEALDLLEVGQKVDITVLRADTKVHLEATVGRSMR